MGEWHLYSPNVVCSLICVCHWYLTILDDTWRLYIPDSLLTSRKNRAVQLIALNRAIHPYELQSTPIITWRSGPSQFPRHTEHIGLHMFEIWTGRVASFQWNVIASLLVKTGVDCISLYICSVLFVFYAENKNKQSNSWCLFPFLSELFLLLCFGNG